MTEILFRSASPAAVRFDRREIDVLAVPYNMATHVRDYDGAEYTETIAPGAFQDVAKRADRVKVFRDHRPDRSIGKCLSIDADRTDGLYATLQISPTELGRESLALAADGVLDVSIGFSPRTERWTSDRSAVTRTNVWLHELSLVPLPAYETATVLAVRQAPLEVVPARSLTPRLDEITAWIAEARYREARSQSTATPASPPLTMA